MYTLSHRSDTTHNFVCIGVAIWSQEEKYIFYNCTSIIIVYAMRLSYTTTFFYTLLDTPVNLSCTLILGIRYKGRECGGRAALLPIPRAKYISLYIMKYWRNILIVSQLDYYQRCATKQRIYRWINSVSWQSLKEQEDLNSPSISYYFPLGAIIKKKKSNNKIYQNWEAFIL